MATSVCHRLPENVFTEHVQCGDEFGILTTNMFVNSGLFENKQLSNFMNDVSFFAKVLKKCEKKNIQPINIHFVIATNNCYDNHYNILKHLFKLQNSQFTIFHKCSKPITDHKFPNTATIFKNVLTADEARKIWLQKEDGGIKNIAFLNRTDYKLSTGGTDISDFQNTLTQQQKVFTHLMPDDASLLFTLPFTSSWEITNFRYFKGSLLHQCFQSQRDNFPRLELIDVDWNEPNELIIVYDRTQILENMSFHLHVRRPSGFVIFEDKLWIFDFWLFKTMIDSYYPNDFRISSRCWHQNSVFFTTIC